MGEKILRLSALLRASVFHSCAGSSAITSTSWPPPSAMSSALQGSRKLHFTQSPSISGSKPEWTKEGHFHEIGKAEKGRRRPSSEAVTGRCWPDADSSVAAASRSLAGHLPRC